jgi:hypothetical protein
MSIFNVVYNSIIKRTKFKFQAAEVSKKKLKSVLQRETAFLQGTDRLLHFTPPLLRRMEVDPGANIMEHYHFQLQGKAIKSTGDGKFLF